MQELRVGCLSSKESLNDLLNVRKACLSLDCLESGLNFLSTIHLFFHLCLEECAPELLSQKVFIHLQLITVFVVIGCLVSDLLLAGVSLNTAL